VTNANIHAITHDEAADASVHTQIGGDFLWGAPSVQSEQPEHIQNCIT